MLDFYVNESTLLVSEMFILRKNKLYLRVFYLNKIYFTCLFFIVAQIEVINPIIYSGLRKGRCKKHGKTFIIADGGRDECEYAVFSVGRRIV